MSLIKVAPLPIRQCFPYDMKFDVMHRQLAILPPEERKTVKLVIGGPYGDALTYNQAAKELGINRNVVVNHCNSARRRLTQIKGIK